MAGGMKITFVMPAYNAEKYISEAVESIRNQTHADWALIIVNDGSTDSTKEEAERLAREDARIRVISLEKGSGSAFQPRKRAILEAETEWVAPLDADDWVEPAYLDKLLKVQEATGADIVYPTMWAPGDNPHPITPTDKHIFEVPRCGRGCIKFTLDGWRINCNGGIIRKDLYVKTFEEFDSTVTYSCADELLTRQLLSLTPAVAFSDAKYFYRPNQESITRKKSAKLFEFLINTQKLIPFVKEIYGEESEEYLLVQRQNFHAYFDALRLLNRYDFSDRDKEFGKSLIKVTRRMIDIDFLRGRVSSRYMALLRFPAGTARRILLLADRLKLTDK